MRYTYVALLAVAALLLSCREEISENPAGALDEQQLTTIENFLEENSIDAQRDDRLFYYRVLTENAGGEALSVGDIASFYYTLTTLEGDTIDQAVAGTDQPARAAIGNGVVKVPVALEALLIMMKEGETYEFFLPSSRAYQDFSKASVVPANAIVSVRLTLADVLSSSEQREVEEEQILAYLEAEGLEGAVRLDSGVYYVPTEAGSGEEVADGKRVGVRYEGLLLDGTPFDDNLDSDTPFEVTIGAGGVIPGFELGLEQMQEGEKGIVIIPSHMAYGASATILPRSIIGDLLNSNRIDPRLGFTQRIPPFAVLRFNLEVESVN